MEVLVEVYLERTAATSRSSLADHAGRPSQCAKAWPGWADSDLEATIRTSDRDRDSDRA